MKTLLTTICLLTCIFASGQDTLRICKVGHPKGLKFAYKIESPKFWDTFMDCTIKDSNKKRLFFKSAENAAKYIGGEIVGYRWKYSPIEPKKVYVVVTKPVVRPNN